MVRSQKTGKILDLIEIKPNKAKSTKEDSGLIENELKAIESVKFLYNYNNDEGKKNLRMTIKETNDIIKNNRSSILKNKFNDNMYYDENLNNITTYDIETYGYDNKSKLTPKTQQIFPEIINKLPTVKVQDIFQMSEMFNLIVLPIQYVEIDRLIEQIKDPKYDSYTIKKAHNKFIKLLEDLKQKK